MLLKKLREQNYDGFNESLLSIHIPIHEGLLNAVMQEVVTTSEGMKDFRSIVFSGLHEDEFLVTIDHKKINKTIRCRLHQITYNKHSEPILVVEFLEGIRFYEKIALQSAITFQKSWKWFKSQFSDNAEKHRNTGSAFDISSSSITINIAELLRQQGLEYLTPLVEWKDISTLENKLIIDLIIKM